MKASARVAMFQRPTITVGTFNRMSLIGFLVCFTGLMGSIVIANMPVFAGQVACASLALAWAHEADFFAICFTTAAAIAIIEAARRSA
jgi:hypothetical protein